jgi:hypothetical protein
MRRIAATGPLRSAKGRRAVVIALLTIHASSPCRGSPFKAEWPVLQQGFEHRYVVAELDQRRAQL